MRRTLVVLPIVLVALGVGAQGHAQNLLPNGGFANALGTDGWTLFSDATWSSIDSDGAPNSGSVRVPRSAPNSGYGPISDCVLVQEGMRHRVAASAFWDAAESTGIGAVHLRAAFFQSDDCTGNFYGGGTDLVAIAPGAWQRIEAYEIAPAGSTSAEVGLWSWLTSPAGSFVAYFDDAELIEVPEPRLGSAGAAGLLALAALARRAAGGRINVGRREDRAR